MDYQLEREVLTAAIKDAHKKGLVYFKAGNLSIRTDDNNVLIKPSGISYEEMTEKDLALVDINGKILSGDLAPSSETPMHTMIYRNFDHVKAVVHTHSENALTCAVTGTVIPIFCNEGIGFGGTIPVSDYAIPGSDAIAENAVKAFNGPPKVTGVLLCNHGAITIGSSMSEASMRAELLEKLAWVYVRAHTLGTVKTFTTERVQKIINHYMNMKK
jgi:L-ribulose-5-phosphate 4-epimerase